MKIAAVAIALCACGGPRTAPPGPTASEATRPAPRATPSPVRSQMPCDPAGTSRPIATPPHPAPVCGNGVIEESWSACVEECTLGCDGTTACETRCQREPEVCDGAATANTCASLGYAGGAIACTKSCQLDLHACQICVPGPGVACGELALVGDTAHVIADGGRAAVFVRDEETGALVGSTVTKQLRGARLRGLPTTLAIAGLGDRLAYVDAQRRFGTIDVRGKVTPRGTLGADRTPIVIFRDSVHAGSAAILVGDGSVGRELALLDPPGATYGDAIRHYHANNVRLIVLGQTVVLAWGPAAPIAFARQGAQLVPASVPAGLALTATGDDYTDVIETPAGRLATRRTASVYAHPPAGLSRAAVAGAQTVAAFGGTLWVRTQGDGRARRAGVYWLAQPDPLAPTTP